MTRSTFRQQVGAGSRGSTFMVVSDEDTAELSTEIEDVFVECTSPFESKFAPSDMRQLALVAHNHMKPAMKEFIESHSEILKKFRITGTQTTMRMCKTLWGEDNPDVEYGLTCTSGPLGGDAQIAALMCLEDLGALIFFVDPLSAHPHQADIDSLVRLANCGNVIVCPNPTSAISMMHTIKMALASGRRGMIPSFFETLESPAVEEYKYQQELALAAAIGGGPANAKLAKPMFKVADSVTFPVPWNEGDDEDDGEDDKFSEFMDVLDVVEEFQAGTFEEEAEGAPKSASASSRGESSIHLHGIKPKRNRTKTGKLAKQLGKSLRKLQVYTRQFSPAV